MTFPPQAFPPSFSPSGSGVGTERPTPEAEWSEDRELAARFMDALSLLTAAAVQGEILRAKYECPGCSHPTHAPRGCEGKPLFTKEDACYCPGDKS